MRDQLLKELTRLEIIPEDWTPSSRAELCRVVYAFLSKTPSPLLGVALDDLGGELEAVNLPGVSAKQKKSWTRRLRLKLEDFVTDPNGSQIPFGFDDYKTMLSLGLTYSIALDK